MIELLDVNYLFLGLEFKLRKRSKLLIVHMSPQLSEDATDLFCLELSLLNYFYFVVFELAGNCLRRCLV